MKKYVNAGDLLPCDLLKKVQEHCTGLVWIPALKKNVARDAKIRELFAQGMGIGDLATLFGMTGRRVRDVTKGTRQTLPEKAELPRESAACGTKAELGSKSEGRGSSEETDFAHVQETSRRKKRLDAKHVSLTVPPAAQGLISRGEQSNY